MPFLLSKTDEDYPIANFDQENQPIGEHIPVKYPDCHLTLSHIYMV